MEEESTDILIKNKDEDEKNISYQKELEQRNEFIYGISTAVIICLIWLAYLFYVQHTEEYGSLLFLFIWAVPLLGVLISSVFLAEELFINNRSPLHYYIQGCAIAFALLTILSFAFCAILPNMHRFLNEKQPNISVQEAL